MNEAVLVPRAPEQVRTDARRAHGGGRRSRPPRLVEELAAAISFGRRAGGHGRIRPRRTVSALRRRSVVRGRIGNQIAADEGRAVGVLAELVGHGTAPQPCGPHRVAECVAEHDDNRELTISLLDRRFLAGDAGRCSSGSTTRFRAFVSQARRGASARGWRAWRKPGAPNFKTPFIIWSRTSRTRPAACATCRPCAGWTCCPTRVETRRSHRGVRCFLARLAHPAARAGGARPERAELRRAGSAERASGGADARLLPARAPVDRALARAMETAPAQRGHSAGAFSRLALAAVHLRIHRVARSRVAARRPRLHAVWRCSNLWRGISCASPPDTVDRLAGVDARGALGGLEAAAVAAARLARVARHAGDRRARRGDSGVARTSNAWWCAIFIIATPWMSTRWWPSRRSNRSSRSALFRICLRESRPAPGALRAAVARYRQRVRARSCRRDRCASRARC